LPGAEKADKYDQRDDTGSHQVVELPSRMLCSRLIAFDIFVTFYALAKIRMTARAIHSGAPRVGRIVVNTSVSSQPPRR
jgi:hypothetical protein